MKLQTEMAAPAAPALVRSLVREAEQKYRPDIDGLRALAVILVVGFHVGTPQLHGGFVGVDVFFVISGFLLTGIITREIAESRFSIAGFYERRARRILPALLAVLAASTVLALHYLLPVELVAYAKSMLGATFSYSNLYFWSTAGYFDTAAEMKPLLHTWSLAVEEQFYVVLPLLLLWLSKALPRARHWVLLLLTAASFAWSVWLSRELPTSAFYLPFSRSWELLTGSLLAIDLFPAPRLRWLRELMSVTGVGMIAYAATALSSATPFPGFAALLPCVGTMLFLAAGKHGPSLMSGVFAWRPVTFIGLISYSVYLWHWPLIVFTRMGFLPMMPRDNRAYAVSILLMSLLLGTLSWWLVERPFRIGALRKLPREKMFGVFATALAVSAAVAFSFIALHGVESRFPPRAIKLAEVMGTLPEELRLGSCYVEGHDGFQHFQKDPCLRLDPGKKNYLLLGDSHAAVLWYGLSKEMTGANILQANLAGCKPYLDSPGSKECGKMLGYIFQEFLPSHRLDGLILSARWSRASDFDTLKGTVQWCQQHHLPVIIFGPVMEYQAPLPKLLAYSIASNDPGIAESQMRREMFAMDRDIREKATQDWGVRYLSVMDVQCPQGKCIPYATPAEDIAMLKDDNHLTSAASEMVVKKLIESGQMTPAEIAPATGKSPVAQVSAR